MKALIATMLAMTISSMALTLTHTRALAVTKLVSCGAALGALELSNNAVADSLDPGISGFVVMMKGRQEIGSFLKKYFELRETLFKQTKEEDWAKKSATMEESLRLLQYVAFFDIVLLGSGSDYLAKQQWGLGTAAILLGTISTFLTVSSGADLRLSYALAQDRRLDRTLLQAKKIIADRNGGPAVRSKITVDWNDMAYQESVSGVPVVPELQHQVQRRMRTIQDFLLKPLVRQIFKNQTALPPAPSVSRTGRPPASLDPSFANLDQSLASIDHGKLKKLRTILLFDLWWNQRVGDYSATLTIKNHSK